MFVVVWAVGGLGRPGGCVRGRQLAVALASRLCGGGGGGWLCVGVGDTPAAACFGGGGCSRVRGVCVCGGGMLSGFWGSAPWLPGLLFCFPLLWVVGCGCGWVGCELYSGREHLTVSFLRQCLFCRVLLLFVFLSVRWMPWHQGPMKDVVACDIPRGAGWRAVIRGFPNGGTRHELCRVTCI